MKKCSFTRCRRRVFCSDKAVAAHEIAVHKDELYPSTAFSLKSEAITCEPDKTDVPYENDQVTNRETIFVCVIIYLSCFRH